MPEGWRYLACNLYLYNDQEQDRWLIDSLPPLLKELESEEALAGFWFDRFDVRGPHLFLIFALRAATWRAARALIRRHLTLPKRSSNPTSENAASIQKRHEECRGKSLCPIDAEKGFEGDGALRLCEQPREEYPLWLLAGARNEPALWAALTAVSKWTIREIESAGGQAATRAALQWIAAVDRALETTGADPQAYWRFHAATLLPNLENQLSGDGAAASLTAVRRIAERKCSAFEPLWKSSTPFEATILALVTEIWGQLEWDLQQRWDLLYSTTHGALKQLGLGVAQHVPAILYAWARHLPAAQERRSVETPA